MQTCSATNLVLLISYLGKANLLYNNKIQFSSWASVLDLCTDDHAHSRVKIVLLFTTFFLMTLSGAQRQRHRRDGTISN
jgi:hypothetical protein